MPPRSSRCTALTSAYITPARPLSHPVCPPLSITSPSPPLRRVVPPPHLAATPRRHGPTIVSFEGWNVEKQGSQGYEGLKNQGPQAPSGVPVQDWLLHMPDPAEEVRRGGRWQWKLLDLFSTPDTMFGVWRTPPRFSEGPGRGDASAHQGAPFEVLFRTT